MSQVKDFFYNISVKLKKRSNINSETHLYTFKSLFDT